MNITSYLRQWLSPKVWKPEWQSKLNEVLLEVQNGLPLSMIVVVARDSDLYAEVLFLFSFLGLSLGAALAFLFQSQVSHPTDLMLFPVAGFAFGASAYHFRGYFISKVAPRAVRDRVAMRAKAVFLDHLNSLRGRLVLLYLSELEREALFVASPDILDEVPVTELKAVLSELDRNYTQRDPLKHLTPALHQVATLLKRSLAEVALEEKKIQSATVFIGASDRPNFPQIPILKGSKDIN